MQVSIGRMSSTKFSSAIYHPLNITYNFDGWSLQSSYQSNVTNIYMALIRVS